MNRCQVCPNNCLLKNSICGRKENLDENVVETTAIAVDPIEKKPLYHFMPGTETLSVGTLGCNLKCLHCQNHSIAQPEHPSRVPIRKISPQSIVDLALDNELESISWTYNEPTIYPEWIINTAKIAQKNNIKTVLVSNGYSSQKTLNELAGYVDAVNIDLKSGEDNFYRDICSGKIEPVLKSIEFYHENSVHTEVTTLLIPGYNDDDKNVTNVAQFIKNLSKDMVLHFSAFYPQFKLMHLPYTTDEIVLKACRRAKKLGLRNVYPGNIHPSTMDNTYCSECGQILVEREYYETKSYIASDCKCPECKKRLEEIII